MSDVLNMPRVDGRDVAAIMDPRPLVIVGAYDPGTERVGFATIIWATPVSHDPAMVAFALRATSHTMGIIQQTNRFSLAVLPPDAESERIVEVCGMNGCTTDKGELVSHVIHGEAPIPAHAYGWEICAVESIAEAGDHLLVIGRVFEAASAAERDAKDCLAPRGTLLCIQHNDYASLTT